MQRFATSGMVTWLLPSALALAACGTDNDSHDATRAATAAVVAGAQDAHCGTKVVAVDANTCHAAPIEMEKGDAGADAGTGGMADMDMDYGPTMFNGEGDDDDCKYHLKWSSGSATKTSSLSLRPQHGGSEGAASSSAATTSFTVTITNKKDGSPVTGAPVDIEAFLDETHPAPNSAQKVTETSPGTYTVGPVAFDVAGKWTVRFHIHDECNDSEASPHGHAAFFTQIGIP